MTLLFFGLAIIVLIGCINKARQRENLLKDETPDGYQEVFMASRTLNSDQEEWMCVIKVFDSSERDQLFQDVIVMRNGINVTDQVKTARSCVYYDSYYGGFIKLLNGDFIDGTALSDEIHIFAK